MKEVMRKRRKRRKLLKNQKKINYKNKSKTKDLNNKKDQLNRESQEKNILNKNKSSFKITNWMTISSLHLLLLSFLLLPFSINY